MIKYLLKCKNKHEFESWFLNSKEYEKLEKKFNQNGWFTCFRDENRTYNSIAFGRPITFETFMEYFKTGKIYFDCGMYQGNNRNYCQWRATNTFWDSLIVETYP